MANFNLADFRYKIGFCSVIAGFLRKTALLAQACSGMGPNLHNLAKWHLKRTVLISRHETWQTVLPR